MREALLHGLWEQQKLPFRGLKITSGEALQIWDPGKLNKNSGPDFLNARMVIGETLWAGHVELHLKSSHWTAHDHGTDPNYQNVILHVVWEDDKEIPGFHGTVLPTLQLRDYVSESVLTSVLRVQSNAKDYLINCQQDHLTVPVEEKESWWLALFKERLIHKSNEIRTWLKASRNNWEQVLFISLMKSFGLQVNREAFLSLALRLDYAVVQKLRYNQFLLEALFLGMAGLFDEPKKSDVYTKELQLAFRFLCTKFALNRMGILRPDFLRLRPANFPTIRLSQLAVLMANQPRLFGKLMCSYKRSDLHKLLAVSPSPYWETHYTFGKQSKRKSKRLSPAFRDLLIINTVAPLLFVYTRAKGGDGWQLLRSLLESCPPEHNYTLNNLSEIGMLPANALQSQALLQSYHHHCLKNRCLECAIGRYLLKGI